MERIVTNTLVNVPAGAAVPPAIAAVAPEVEAAQEGGSLTDTLTAPMLELCMGGTFPPQPTAIIISTAKMKTGRKGGLGRPLKRNRALEIIGASATEDELDWQPAVGQNSNARSDHRGWIRRSVLKLLRAFTRADSTGQPSPILPQQSPSLWSPFNKIWGLYDL